MRHQLQCRAVASGLQCPKQSSSLGQRAVADRPATCLLPACLLQWNAQARKANTVAARKLQHEKHVALIKLRSQVAQAAKQQ